MVNNKRCYMNISKHFQLLSREVTLYAFNARQSFLGCFHAGIKFFREDFQKFLSCRTNIERNILWDFFIQSNMISVIMRKQYPVARLTVKHCLGKRLIPHGAFHFAVGKICSKVDNNAVVICADFRCASADLMASAVYRNFILLIHKSLPFPIVLINI